MNSIVFHVDADKVGPNLAESIKAYFGNRRVQIIVKPDETTTDMTARDEDDEAQNYALPYDDIARIAAALERNEPVDVAAEMKKFMAAE
jgi:myo-inositol-1-phosphate synthase